VAMDGDWTEAAWLGPPPVEERARHAEIESALDEWLTARGLARNDLDDSDIRIDVIYLGRETGQCATRVLIRTAALGGK
jgi:hypothetical protein